MLFEYTDAHGIKISDSYPLTKIEYPLIGQCKNWNTYDILPLQEHNAIYYTFIRDQITLEMSLEPLEGAKLIIASYEAIGDRHYRIIVPSADSQPEIVIKGLGLLETTEPPNFESFSSQHVKIHNKLVKVYFPLFRLYEIDFTMGKMFVHSLAKGYPEVQ